MNELELIATAVIMDRTAGNVVEAAGRAVATRVANRVERLRSRMKARAGSQELDIDDRMALKVLAEAASTDDDVLIDYLGGVLLASNGGHRADQGISVLATLSRLSAMQIRGHFAIYSAYRHLLKGTDLNFYDDRQTQRLTMLIDQTEFFRAVGVDPSDIPTPHPVPHVTNGLVLSALIGRRHFGGSEAETLQSFGVPEAEAAGLVVTPAPAGVELYMWGLGSEVLDANRFTDTSLPLHALLATPPGLESARLVTIGDVPDRS